ncbi:MAG: adenosine deaminase family protein [Verrucomicrobiota bacterium]
MRHPFLLLLAAPVLAAAPFSTRFEEIKRTATPVQLYTFLYALPKGGDLHNHLGGSARAEWWHAVATDPARNGGDTFYTRTRFHATPGTGVTLILYHTLRQHGYDALSDTEKADYTRLDHLSPEQKQGWLDSLRLDRPGEGRDEFFTWVWPRLGQLGSNLPVTGEILVEIIKAYGAEGMRYLETQQGAMGFTDNAGRPIPPDEVAAYLRDRLAKPDAVASGVTVRFQSTVLRFLPGAELQLENHYRFVDAHRDLWVGINMAGIEENNKGHPARFLAKYRELRRAIPTLALSIHGGEMDWHDSHVRDTLLLGASRIGHGLNLIQDPDTLLLLQQSRRVLVEINLISNRLLEYTPDLTAHPFPEYLRTGIPVCLCTDDRGMWDSNLTDEYYTAVTTYNLSWEEIVQLGRNSLVHSFAPPGVKAALLADYEKALAAFEARFATGDLTGALSGVRPVAYGYAKRTWGFEFR